VSECLYKGVECHQSSLYSVVVDHCNVTFNGCGSGSYIPFTSTWPHLRCDVGLEEGNIEKKLSVCYCIVYYYNGAQRYEQFLQVGRLYRALILLGLVLSSERLCVFGLHGT